MDWRIEASRPTAPDGVAAALESARDNWIKTTAQESDAQVANANGAILMSHNEARGSVVRLRNDLIEAHSSNLDDTHSRVVAQMNAGIQAASVMAKASGFPLVRVSVFGHYMDGHLSGVDNRVNVNMDEAYERMPPHHEMVP
jgi:hypothetical protein